MLVFRKILSDAVLVYLLLLTLNKFLQNEQANAAWVYYIIEGLQVFSFKITLTPLRIFSTKQSLYNNS